MIRKYIIPLVAVAGVLFAIWTVVQSAKPVAPAKLRAALAYVLA